MDREREVYRLHTEEGWTLVEIACRYHVSRERVRQLLREYVHASTGKWPSPRAMSRTAAQARRTRKLALAQAHARHIMSAWRAGEELKEIAARFELGRRHVEQVVREEATSDDRAARVRARRLMRAGLGCKPSSEQRVLHALSVNPGATASELATATGLAYGTTTVALCKLERSGRATRAKGEYKAGVRLPDRWTAVRLS
jgi:Mor family transcriptional regulator